MYLGNTFVRHLHGTLSGRAWPRVLLRTEVARVQRGTACAAVVLVSICCCITTRHGSVWYIDYSAMSERQTLREPDWQA